MPSVNGQEISQKPLTILQLMARREENGERTKVADIMEETELSRGSVHNFIKNTLADAGLVIRTNTEPQRGGVPDAQIWGLTVDGYEFLESLDPSDYAPVVTSSEAVKKSSDARSMASEARSTADQAAKSVSKIEDQVESIERSTAKASAVDKEIDSLKHKIRNLDNSLSDAERLDQRVLRDLRELHEQVDRMDNYVYDLGVTFYGDPENEDDDGHRGRITNVESKVSEVGNEVSEMKKEIEQWRHRTLYIGLIAVLAFVAAASILIV
jgi:DNA-binding transcriptional regulator GbsR (MarR family)